MGETWVPSASHPPLRPPHCRSQHPENDDDITPPPVAIGSVNGMGCFHRCTRIFGTTKTVEVYPNFCSFLPPSALARLHGDAWGSSVNHGVCALLERPKWPLAVKAIPIEPVDARAIRRCEVSKSPSFISQWQSIIRRWRTCYGAGCFFVLCISAFVDMV